MAEIIPFPNIGDPSLTLARAIADDCARKVADAAEAYWAHLPRHLKDRIWNEGTPEMKQAYHDLDLAIHNRTVAERELDRAEERVCLW